MSSISAGTTTTTGYVVTSDSTGALVLKTGSSATTAMTIDTSQNVTFVGSQTLSAGTANGVLYLNGSKVATSGSALVFDGTNFGVGTSNPAAKLESVSTASGAGGWFMAGQLTAANYPMLRFAATTPNKYASIGNNGDGSLNFFVNGSSGTVGSSALELNPSGNLGLGVTPSAWDGSFKAFQVSNTSLFSQDSTGAGWWSKNARNVGGTWYYIGTGFASYIEQGAGAFKWNTSASGTAGNAITFTQAMTLDASGNLGVGTTSPATRLQVAGSTGLTLGAVSGNAWRTAAIVPIDEGSDNKGSLAFYTHPSAGSAGAPTERARIDSSGNLLVGTTSSSTGIDTGATRMFVVAPNSNFGAALTTVGDNQGRGIRFTDQARAVQGALDAGNSKITFGSNSSHPLTFITGGTEKARIDTSGSFSITQSPGQYTIDTAGGGATVANGGTVNFSTASGMLIVNDWGTGWVTMYLCGGGGTAIVTSVGGTVGSFAYNSGINGYTWTNNTGRSAPFGFQFFRTRANA